MEGEETIENETLFREIKGGLEDALEWVRGETKAQISRNVDGQWITTEETKSEFLLRQDEEAAQETIRYNAEGDALAIRLSDTPMEHYNEIEPGLVLGYDANGNVVNVEVRRVSERIQKPQIEEAA